jgi:hypothetical protein
MAYYVNPNLNVPGGGTLKHEIHLSKTDGSDGIQVKSIVLGEIDYFDRNVLFWSPNDAILLLQVRECDPRCEEYRQYIIDTDGALVAELPEEVGRILNDGAWSPDGRLFLYGKYIQQEEGLRAALGLLDTETMEVQVLMLDVPENFRFRRILWLPE